MKLVMVAQDFPPDRGGIQTYALELARRWAPRCASFRVIAGRHPDARAFDDQAGFEVHRVRGSGNAFAAAALPELARARGTLTFHTQWPSAAAELGLPRSSGKNPIALAAHGREILLAPWSAAAAAQRGYDAIRRRAFRRADRVLAVSRYTGDLVLGLGVDPSRLRVIGNGTDATRFSPVAVSPLRQRLGLEDAFVFVSVARLVARKGIDQVLRACALLPKLDPRPHLVVVGDGPERTALEHLAHGLGLAGHVTFAGKVPEGELPDWYRAGDAFVLPARSTPPDVEGFGIAFLEASATELPVIGPNQGGPIDAIVDGVTGMSIDPASTEALAAAMLRLVRDRSWAKQLGRAGRRRVLEHATWDHTAQRAFDELVACSEG